MGNHSRKRKQQKASSLVQKRIKQPSSEQSDFPAFSLLSPEIWDNICNFSDVGSLLNLKQISRTLHEIAPLKRREKLTKTYFPKLERIKFKDTTPKEHYDRCCRQFNLAYEILYPNDDITLNKKLDALIGKIDEKTPKCQLSRLYVIAAANGHADARKKLKYIDRVKASILALNIGQLASWEDFIIKAQTTLIEILSHIGSQRIFLNAAAQAGNLRLVKFAFKNFPKLNKLTWVSLALRIASLYNKTPVVEYLLKEKNNFIRHEAKVKAAKDAYFNDNLPILLLLMEHTPLSIEQLMGEVSISDFNYPLPTIEKYFSSYKERQAVEEREKDMLIHGKTFLNNYLRHLQGVENEGIELLDNVEECNKLRTPVLRM